MEVKSSPLRSMIGGYPSVAITIGAFCQAPSTPLGGSHVYTTKGSIFNPIISHFLDPHTNLYCTSGVTTHLGSDDMQEYSSRPPQIDQSDLTNNCSARQIYLTFPPDSIFSKEDVCNYFRYHMFHHSAPIDVSCFNIGAFHNLMNAICFGLFVLCGDNQHVWDGARCAYPIPGEAHVWFCHLHLPKDSEANSCQGQPTLHL